MVGSAEPPRGVRAQVRRVASAACRELGGDRAPGASIAKHISCMLFKAIQKLNPMIQGQTSYSTLKRVPRAIELSQDTSPLLNPIALQKFPNMASSAQFQLTRND